MTPSTPTYTIKFDGCAETLPLSEFSDEAMEAARQEAERLLGRKLPLDPKTGYPSFTVYRDGVEIGGG
jgi:hypothetical protein